MTALQLRKTALIRASVLATILAVGCRDQAQRQFAAAYRLQNEGKLDVAMAEYQRLIAEHPTHPITASAHYQLAYLYRTYKADPDQALAHYQAIADKHPRSVFADDALLYVASLARQQGNVERVRSAVKRLESSYAHETSQCARARIQLAVALLEKGDVECKAVCESILKLYPDHPSQCAQAQLLLARAIEKLDKDSDKAIAHFEQVMAKYPNTPSAIEARQEVGWIFFSAAKARPSRKADQPSSTARQQAKRIQGVPPFGQDSQLNMQRLTIEGLGALLRQQKVEIDTDTLMAVSGAAFQFVYNPEDRSMGAHVFATNPFETAAQSFGFDPLKGSSGSAEEAMLSLCQMIDRGKPVLVPHNIHGWVVVIGYDPNRKRFLYLRPGASTEQSTEFAAFAAQWKAAGDKVGGEMASFYQFALGPRSSQPNVTEIVRGAARRGVSLLRRTTVFGAPAGLAAYETLAADLEAHASGDLPADASDLAAWADEPLSILDSARSSAERFLSANANALPEPMASVARAAANDYGALRAKLAELREIFPVPPEGQAAGSAQPEYAAAAKTAAQRVREAMKLEREAAGRLSALAGE
ncbi:MAG: tetratricopeptide repeat protein [Candidatus Zipacnadales bacterium]